MAIWPPWSAGTAGGGGAGTAVPRDPRGATACTSRRAGGGGGPPLAGQPFSGWHRRAQRAGVVLLVKARLPPGPAGGTLALVRTELGGLPNGAPAGLAAPVGATRRGILAANETPSPVWAVVPSAPGRGPRDTGGLRRGSPCPDALAGGNGFT